MPQIPLDRLCVSKNIGLNPKSSLFVDTLKLSKIITKYSWSPIIFNKGERKEKNFLYSDWAVLDYDDGMTSIEQATNTFSDCIHIIGTTKSHTKDHHRYRVCVPWSERITNIDVFKHNQATLIKHHDTDGQCKDGARFYYPCKEIVSTSAEGFRAEVSLQIPKKVFEPAHFSKTGFSSAVTFFMKNVIHQGQRNTQIYQVCKDLFRIGLDKQCTFQIIMKSPTYRGNSVSSDLQAEIRETMESAWRSIYP